MEQYELLQWGLDILIDPQERDADAGHDEKSGGPDNGIAWFHSVFDFSRNKHHLKLGGDHTSKSNT